MGISTVSGPFRSKNGFQELVNGEWVPVAGGGGGGSSDVPITLTAGFANPAIPDNRYSDDKFSVPPSGPTAGNIIQLPVIEVFQSYIIGTSDGYSSSAWAIQTPSIAGVDISTFVGNYTSLVSTGGNYGSLTPYFAITTPGGPNNLLYLYGIISIPLRITRLPDEVVPGFGVLAFFQISNINMVFVGDGFGDPAQYPFVDVIGP